MTAAICKNASLGLSEPRRPDFDIPAGLRKVVFRHSATNQTVVLCKGVAYYADAVRIHGPAEVTTALLPDIFADRRGGCVMTLQVSTFAPVELVRVQKEVLDA